MMVKSVGATAPLNVGDDDPHVRGMDRAARNRIRDLISAKGWSPRRASLEAGLGATYVRDLLERDRGGSTTGLAKLAAALGVTVDYILTGRASGAHVNTSHPQITPAPGKDRVKTVPVRGKASAGQWMEIEEDFSYSEPISAVETTYAGSQFAFRVVGSSMTRRRIFDGDYVICVDQAPMETGRLFVIERHRGGLTERTVKELVVKEGVYEFWPRSDDERFQTPIVVKPSEWTEEDGTVVEVVGLVLSVQFPISY